MRHFHYAGVRDQGAEIQGWVMAADRDDAIVQLRDRGVHPYSVQAGPGQIPIRVDEDELLVSMRELSSLRRSGMGIDDAVAAVIDTAEDKALIRAWTQVHQMVRSGSTLSDAFAGVPFAFPGYSVPLIRLGEANGELAEAVSLVANRIEEEAALKSEIRTAFAYPVFLIVISIAVVLFMLVSVVPEFGSIVADSPEDVGGSMQFLLAISGLLVDYALLWIGLAVVLAAGSIYLWQAGRIQSTTWGFVKSLPGVASIVAAWEVVQFCNSMSHLLRGRVAVLDAVQLSSQSLSSDALSKKLRRACDLVRQGQTLGAALSEVEAFPKLVIQMIAVGEKSADLTLAMNEISELYTRRMRESIRKAMAVLEPAVIAFMGVVVGGIIISLLSAIITVNDIPL